MPSDDDDDDDNDDGISTAKGYFHKIGDTENVSQTSNIPVTRLATEDISCDVANYNLFSKNKPAEVNTYATINNHKIYTSYGSDGNLNRRKFEDFRSSNLINKPLSRAPSPQENYQGPLVRPSIKTPLTAKNRSNGSKYSLNRREQPYLVRPIQPRINGTVPSIKNDVDLKSAPIQLAHYVHTSNVKSCNDNSVSVEDNAMNPKKESVLDAALILSTQFKTCNNTRERNGSYPSFNNH